MAEYKHEYTFPEAKQVVVSGDIHGKFNALVFKMCVQYGMTDTLLIVAGDCGFGFEHKISYEQMTARNARRMKKANNWIVFVRGNHDNPAYFDGEAFFHERLMAVPDYSIIKACSKTILCIGGAISIDRQWRWDEMEKHPAYAHDANDTFSKSLYWDDEAPVFDEALLTEISEHYKVDTVITHTAPSCCELTSKDGLEEWADMDYTLLEDATAEREVMDKILSSLVAKNHPLSHWYYGHFHQSWHSSIDGVFYKMLDIMEFCEIK